ncbi:MAG: sigma-70 family RNA polymerase sigma factor [Gammaproteobacteria bacterium]|nr:sigma-70 family RNA polymerase sigma factor [Gammaproteobacteria bacterium]
MSTNPLHSLDARVTAQRADENHALLIDRIARRDEDAFNAFYEATMPRVYGLALAITKSPDMAEDVVIDVFLQVWRNAAKYDGKRGRPLTWLLIMCRSRAIDAAAGSKFLLAEWEPLSACTAVEEQPEHQLAVLQRERAVASALNQLSAIQRRLIGLAFFRGLSHGEINAATDIPLGTVKTHIRKGLKTLAGLLADGRARKL